MSFLGFVFSVLPFLFLQIFTGEAIECYDCRSEVNPGCETAAPDIKYITNCSNLKEGPKYQACRKIDEWVDFKVLDQEPTRRVVRQCASDVERDRPCYYRAGYGGRVNVCDCFDDKCNTASFVFSSATSIAFCLLMIHLILWCTDWWHSCTCFLLCIPIVMFSKSHLVLSNQQWLKK